MDSKSYNKVMQDSEEIRPWKEIKRLQVFKKYSRSVDKVVFELPNGSQADFYIKVEGPASGIVGLTKDNLVILVKQYRPGPKQVLYELPGGFTDPGEGQIDAAKREFLEETGYTGDFKLAGKCIDDAYSTMVRYCFIATNCKKVQEPEETETEKTKVTLLPLDEFRNLLRSGNMTDVEMGYLGLDHLGLL